LNKKPQNREDRGLSPNGYDRTSIGKIGGFRAKRSRRSLAESWPCGHAACGEGFGEAPLVKITNREECEAWLRKQTREVAVAFAARAALRVLPVVQLAEREGFLDNIVLPVFRATAVSWAASRFSSHQTDLSAAADAAKIFNSARFFTNTGNASTIAVKAASRAATTTATSPSASTTAATLATVTVGEAAEAAHSAGFSSGYVHYSVAIADREAAASAFWSAVSIDATRLEEGVTASIIASSPLWPQPQSLPDRLRFLWEGLQAELLVAKQGWEVWTDWYEARLRGDPVMENLEIGRATISNEIWNRGPAQVNAEIKGLIEKHEPRHYGVQLDTSSVALGSGNASMSAVENKTHDSIPPEPLPEPGPVLQVTERGLEIVSQLPSGDIDEEVQKALHDRLRRLLPELTDATHRVANAHPALDHIVSEYSDLIARPFDQLDVASLWAVGTGLLAFRAAFTNLASGTMSEPLEPGHFALLQQAAELHGGFILGFPKGRELTDRADHARLSPEIIAQIAAPAHRILEELAGARDFVEARTRKFLSVIDKSLIVHGWETARIGHSAYVITRNGLIALGKYLILANIGCAAILGKPILPALDLDPHTSPTDRRIFNDSFAGDFELCGAVP
jgi:hypothetical protein